MKKQLLKKIKKSGDFSLQLDESTDIGKCIELLTYIPVSGPGDLEKNFLFCKPPETTTKGVNIFNLVNSFSLYHGIEWFKCFSVCCDRAPSMLGAQKGFVSKVKNLAISVVYCLL